MKNCLIDFQDIDWEAPAPGVQHKAYVKDNQRLRLVEFSDEFVEDSWCTKGHVGYILEGSISIDFDGTLIHFKAGDGLFIQEGKENKHKAKIAKDKKALIILFEKV